MMVLLAFTRYLLAVNYLELKKNYKSAKNLLATDTFLQKK